MEDDVIFSVSAANITTTTGHLATDWQYDLDDHSAVRNEDICANSSNCNGPHVLDITPTTVVVSGYIIPPLVMFTLVINCVVCVVLFRKPTRGSTDVFLMAMAISDTLTGLWPFPFFVNFYTSGLYMDWLPYEWCFAYNCLIEYLPTVFHTASIWLTVCLAVQRYIYIRHNLTAKRLCTVKNTIRTVVGVYIFSFASQSSRFAELQFYPIELNSRVDPTRLVVGCFDRHASFVSTHLELYYNLYYMFRIVVIHLVPCTSLVVLNAILVLAMQAARRRRRQLLMQNRRTESRKLEESASTTLMLVTVVGLFLLVEVPLAIFLVVFIWNNNQESESDAVMTDETINLISLILNLFILLSYPLNFFIYCGMSRQFRETFRSVVLGGFTGRRRDRQPGSATVCDQSQYVTMIGVTTDFRRDSCPTTPVDVGIANNGSNKPEALAN